MSRQCTWVDCQNEAIERQLDKQGNQWADLCEIHKVELLHGIAAGVPKVLSVWIKAQGGAKKAAERM